jgi:hypothetical protein
MAFSAMHTRGRAVGQASARSTRPASRFCVRARALKQQDAELAETSPSSSGHAEGEPFSRRAQLSFLAAVPLAMGAMPAAAEEEVAAAAATTQARAKGPHSQTSSDRRVRIGVGHAHTQPSIHAQRRTL